MPKASVITQEFQDIQAALEVLEPLDPTQRQFAVSMILSRLRMEAAPGATLRACSHPSTVAGAGCTAATGLNVVSAKEFMKLKAPTTDFERLICLADYLTHAQDTTSFTTRGITKLNADVHGTDFTNAAATAMNAVRQSKLLSTATGGKKRINTRGAPRSAVLRLVLRRGMALTFTALTLGWPAAWMLAKIASSFLYGISPHDAVTFTLVPIVLSLVALVAAWIPARRAASVNPTEALRME